jgi:protein required for attachment to host cells
MNKIIITADKGHFKAFRVSKEKGVPESPKIDLIISTDYVEAHGKMSDKVTDSAGRYKQGTGAGFGEQHNIALENEKRLIKQISDDINAILSKEQCDGWYLAAAPEINSQALDNVNDALKAKLEKNVKANLTNISKSEILKHFEG